MNSVTLNITERCNLRCRYCDLKKTDAVMSAGTMRGALDFLNPEEHVNIGLFGGEPLLESVFIGEVISECSSRFRRFTLSITTNGTLVTDGILDMFEGIDVRFAVSVDGVGHDLNRVHPNGRPSFEETKKGTSVILSRYPDSSAMCTVTPDTIDLLSESVRMISELGFGHIGITPDYTRNDWNMDTLRDSVLSALSVADGLDVEILGADRGKISPCTIGDNVFVDTNGTVYPCISFKGHPDMSIGNVSDGISEEKVSLLRNSMPAIPERCVLCEHMCECRNRCGCIRLLSTGGIDGISDAVCEFEKAFAVHYHSKNQKR